MSDLIASDHRIAPYFEGYLGALDGTLIPAHVPIAAREPYRERKAGLSMNVLAACSFDMRFCMFCRVGRAQPKTTGYFKQQPHQILPYLKTVICLVMPAKHQVEVRWYPTGRSDTTGGSGRKRRKDLATRNAKELFNLRRRGERGGDLLT